MRQLASFIMTTLDGFCEGLNREFEYSPIAATSASG